MPGRHADDRRRAGPAPQAGLEGTGVLGPEVPSGRAREVITLRDVEGWAGEEVSALLQITPNNQRVLPHRARSKARQALERYFGEG